MNTEYIVFKRYEKRMGAGKFPEIITMYLSEGLPHIEMTRNIEEAMRFDEEEAKKIAYITDMSFYKKVNG